MLKNSLNKIFGLFILLLMPFQVFGQQDSISVNNSATAVKELKVQLDEIFNDPNFSGSTWGVLVKSLTSGEILYKRNENKLFVPASVLKLFTTASSLLLLGPEYKYNTEIYTDGKIIDGKLNGNLIIKGKGDPTFSSRFYKECTEVFEMWADSLLAKGIKVIDGDIIGDDNLFDSNGLGKGWSWDYEGKWFAAPTSALSFNDNCVDINVQPTSLDMPAFLEIIPQTKYVDIINNVKTVKPGFNDKIKIFRGRGKNLITVFGGIKNELFPITKHVSVDSPTLYLLTVMSEVFEKKGIVIAGNVTDFSGDIKEDNYDGFIKLFEYKSTSLKNIIREVNKNSNNFCSEQLLKTLGLELFGFGNIENGVKSITDLLNIMGINSRNMVIADGSGLSRLNLLTPRQIVNLLSYMYKSNEFKNFYESLPIAGIDGTLADRMNYSGTENNVRAKSGSIESVNSIAGYIQTADDEPLVFTVIVNNFLVPNSLANYIEDMVCVRLANFSRN